jgi:hypothetical protein
VDRTGDDPWRNFIVLLVMVVAIWGTIAAFYIVTGVDSRTSTEKSLDRVAKKAHTPDPTLCIQGDEVVISSKCSH